MRLRSRFLFEDWGRLSEVEVGLLVVKGKQKPRKKGCEE